MVQENVTGNVGDTSSTFNVLHVLVLYVVSVKFYPDLPKRPLVDKGNQNLFKKN